MHLMNLERTCVSICLLPLLQRSGYLSRLLIHVAYNLGERYIHLSSPFQTNIDTLYDEISVMDI